MYHDILLSHQLFKESLGFYSWEDWGWGNYEFCKDPTDSVWWGESWTTSFGLNSGPPVVRSPVLCTACHEAPALPILFWTSNQMFRWEIQSSRGQAASSYQGLVQRWGLDSVFLRLPRLTASPTHHVRLLCTWEAKQYPRSNDRYRKYCQAINIVLWHVFQFYLFIFICTTFSLWLIGFVKEMPLSLGAFTNSTALQLPPSVGSLLR